MTQSCRSMAFPLIVAASFLAVPAPAEKVVFRDGKSTTASRPPCISGEKILIEIEGLPTPIAYDRNLIDEARTFHANPQTPLPKLFAPCTATGPVAEGAAGSGQGLTTSPSSAPPAPVKAYSAPSSGGRSSSEAISGQCAATTKKGTRCSRRAQPGRAYCYQH